MKNRSAKRISPPQSDASPAQIRKRPREMPVASRKIKIGRANRIFLPQTGKRPRRPENDPRKVNFWRAKRIKGCFAQIIGVAAAKTPSQLEKRASQAGFGRRNCPEARRRWLEPRRKSSERRRNRRNHRRKWKMGRRGCPAGRCNSKARRRRSEMAKKIQCSFQRGQLSWAQHEQAVVD